MGGTLLTRALYSQHPHPSPLTPHPSPLTPYRSFRSYFELPNDTDEVIAEFGYTLQQVRLPLPKTNRPLPGLPEFQQQLEDTLPFVRLTSEAAKREILVAPILARVAVLSQQVLRIEYPLKVNHQLQGNLDYLIRANYSLVVVEAKRDDLARGFT